VTWKEFKEWAEAKGVQDNDNIEWMDFRTDPERLTRELDEDGEGYIQIDDYALVKHDPKR
jgi:hypothetical protein